MAAIVALLIAHLDIIRLAVSPCSVRWGIALLVGAMLLGVVVKYLGILIRTGVAVTGSLYQHLNSPEGQSNLSEITIPLDQLSAELSKPFWWPFRQLLERAGKRGIRDPLNSEKRFIKMLCVQSYCFYAMCLAGAVALTIRACGLHE